MSEDDETDAVDWGVESGDVETGEGEREDVRELVERLHAELRATEELPVERSASRWIGEAQAVAADAAGGDLSEDIIRERVGHVRDLLANVEETGDGTADERVERAKTLAATIASET